MGELLLGLGEAGAGPPVLGVDLGGKGTAVGAGTAPQIWGFSYHFEKNDRQDSVYGEEPGHHHHHHGHGQVGLEHADGGDPAAVRKTQTRLILSSFTSQESRF